MLVHPWGKAYLRREEVVEENVAGLDIPVQDPRSGGFVEVLQAPRDSQRDPNAGSPVEGLPPPLHIQRISEAPLGHVLENQKPLGTLPPALYAVSKQGHNVAMVQLRYQFDLRRKCDCMKIRSAGRAFKFMTRSG